MNKTQLGLGPQVTAGGRTIFQAGCTPIEYKGRFSEPRTLQCWAPVARTHDPRAKIAIHWINNE